MKTFKKLEQTLNDNGWNVTFEKNGKSYSAEISKYSPAGEDFSFDIDFDGTVDDAIYQIGEYSRDFTPDDHAALFFESAGRNGTPSVRTLIEDADSISEMLDYLVMKLQEFQIGIRTFTVQTKFVFYGTFKVKAKNRKEATEKVKSDCGLCLGGDINSTLPSEDIDWEFDVHPKKIVQ